MAVKEKLNFPFAIVNLRAWKAALTKLKLSFSDESVNNGLDYLNKEVFKNI